MGACKKSPKSHSQLSGDFQKGNVQVAGDYVLDLAVVKDLKFGVRTSHPVTAVAL